MDMYVDTNVYIEPRTCTQAGFTPGYGSRLGSRGKSQIGPDEVYMDSDVAGVRMRLLIDDTGSKEEGTLQHFLCTSAMRDNVWISL